MAHPSCPSPDGASLGPETVDVDVIGELRVISVGGVRVEVEEEGAGVV